jgi:hypothetical protein
LVDPDCEQVADSVTLKVGNVYCVTDDDATLFTAPREATTENVNPIVEGTPLRIPW